MKKPHRVLREMASLASLVLTVEIKNARPPRAGSGFSGEDDRMIEAIEKLTAGEMLSFSVEKFASKFHSSPRHLARLFYQYFGISVCGVKMEIRLLKAESLLRNDNTKLTSVAEGSGFNHVGLFNTCFEKRFGVSPVEWRRRHGGARGSATGAAGS